MRNHTRQAFTLIETMVVLLILAAMAAITVPAMVSFVGKKHDEEAASKASILDVQKHRYLSEYNSTAVAAWAAASSAQDKYALLKGYLTSPPSLLGDGTASGTYTPRGYLITLNGLSESCTVTKLSTSTTVYPTSGTSSTYLISASANDTSMGAVVGGGTYASGESVTVTAQPLTGYAFVDWLEGGTIVATDASYTFTATKARTLTALFQASASGTYTLTMLRNNTTAGSVSPGSGSYTCGSSVTISATPNSNWSFDSWSGDIGSASAASSSLTLSMNQDRTVQANFVRSSYTLSVSPNDASKGGVSGGGTIPAGTTTTVTATAYPGYQFVNWLNGTTIVSTASSYSLAVTGNISLTATFTTTPTTGVTPGTYGSSTNVGQFTVDAQGRILSASNVAIDGASSLGTMSTQNANAVAITGGTITGTAISGSSFTGGTISGATVSGATLTGGTISGATMNSSPIGQTTPAAGTFTSLSATGTTTFSALYTTTLGVNTTSVTSGYNADVGGNLILSGSNPQVRFNSGGSWLLGGTNTLYMGTGSTAAASNATVTVNATGLGIGTTSPGNKLDVQGGGIQVNNSTAEGGAVFISNNSKTGANTQTWAIWNMTGAYGDGLSFWRYYGNGTNAGPSLWLADNGYVSVGANGSRSPSTDLTIGSGGATNGSGALGVLLSRGAMTNFFEANDGTKDWIGGVDNTLGYGKVGMLSAHDMGIVTGNAVRMYVQNSTGNIGIGTTSPTQALDVAGSIGIKANNTAFYLTDSSGTERRTALWSPGNSIYYGDVDNSQTSNLLLLAGGSGSVVCYSNSTELTRMNSSGLETQGDLTSHALVDGQALRLYARSFDNFTWGPLVFENTGSAYVGGIGYSPLGIYFYGYGLSTNPLFLKTGGYVGLMNSDPKFPLDFGTSRANNGRIIALYGTSGFFSGFGQGSGLDVRIAGDPSTYIADFGHYGLDGNFTWNSKASISASGAVSAASYNAYSSRRFKDKITPIDDRANLAKAVALQPVSYDWKPGQGKGGHDIGFIAEDLAEILPEVVGRDADGKPNSIDYGRVTTVLTGAIRALKEENDALRADLRKIEDEVRSRPAHPAYLHPLVLASAIFSLAGLAALYGYGRWAARDRRDQDHCDRISL